jgi:hypothetical protein
LLFVRRLGGKLFSLVDKTMDQPHTPAMTEPNPQKKSKLSQSLLRWSQQTGITLPEFNLRAYLFGIFSMPWIWVWSYVFLASGYVIFLYLNQSNSAIQTTLQNQSVNQNIPVYLFWEFTLFSCFINYTLAYLTRRSYPRLESLLFLISLLLLMILVILLWPYFSFLFR